MLGFFASFLEIVVKPTSKNYLLGFIMMLKMVQDDDYAHGAIAAATFLLALATCCLHGDGGAGSDKPKPLCGLQFRAWVCGGSAVRASFGTCFGRHFFE